VGLRERNAQLPSSYPREALLSCASANAFSLAKQPPTNLFTRIPDCTMRFCSAAQLGSSLNAFSVDHDSHVSKSVGFE
jgi:hypothetical protein